MGQQFAPLSIDTQVIRPEQTTSEGTRIELFVQVVYDTQGGPETRQANIECTVDAKRLGCRGGTISLNALTNSVAGGEGRFSRTD